VLACQPSVTDSGKAAPPVDLNAQPLTPQAFTTLQGVWAPMTASDEGQARINAEEVTVADLDEFDALGLGVRWDPGIPWTERTELAPGFVEGADRRSVMYLWQAADPQIIDEESPIRFEAWSDLYRPNGHLTVHSFEAHVASASRLSELSGRPFDFALMAGDLTDGSQQNELGWFVQSLVGGAIDPDSGADDDPVAGPDNDYNDPFYANGLAVPWYAAIGNHETLYNGGFGQLDEVVRAAAVGTTVYDSMTFPNGYRDGSTLTAEVRTDGTFPADEARKPLYRREVLATLQSAGGLPSGHGLDLMDVFAGRGYFSVTPVPGRPFRLLVLDTVHTTGMMGEAALGWVDQDQLLWLQRELAEADANDELILVMSHHQLQDISGTSPVAGDDIAAALAASDGVFLLVTGHGHTNETDLLPDDWDGADPTLGFWQLMLASTVDFPMHSRVIEVVDERNGYLSVYATNIDHNSPVDSLAHKARNQAAAKLGFGGIATTPDIAGDWAGEVANANHLLRIRIPEALSNRLADGDYPARVESLQTLSMLSAPDLR
jgi:3',5'-cyclic AMP phosphodiesterase CpdA